MMTSGEGKNPMGGKVAQTAASRDDAQPSLMPDLIEA